MKVRVGWDRVRLRRLRRGFRGVRRSVLSARFQTFAPPPPLTRSRVPQGTSHFEKGVERVTLSYWRAHTSQTTHRHGHGTTETCTGWAHTRVLSTARYSGHITTSLLDSHGEAKVRDAFLDERCIAVGTKQRCTGRNTHGPQDPHQIGLF